MFTLAFFFSRGSMASTGFYGYNIHKKKERKNQSEDDRTTSLCYILFFLNSTRVTTQHFVFHCYSIAQKHAHTYRQDAVALCTEKTLFGTTLAPNNNRPTESTSVPVPQTRTKHDMSQLRAFKTKLTGLLHLECI